MATLHLPPVSSDYGDKRLALYCLPFVSDILRIETSLQTIKLIRNRCLTQDEKIQTRIDISKWIIGMVPAAIIALASPLTGLITSIVATVALILTCIEQVGIIFASYDLSQRDVSAV
jgi:hypothetical protein